MLQLFIIVNFKRNYVYPCESQYDMQFTSLVISRCHSKRVLETSNKPRKTLYKAIL